VKAYLLSALVFLGRAASASYSVLQLAPDPQDPTTLEYRLYRDAHHFGTFVHKAVGELAFRPHPGLDVNGWGSSWYAQPFFPGAALSGALVDSVVAGPGGIRALAHGTVSTTLTCPVPGTFTLDLQLAYDPQARQIAGAGTYQITLDPVPWPPSCDLNVYRLASNRLLGVPLLGGGTGDTGDMQQAAVAADSFGAFAWTPSIPPDDGNDHCPSDAAELLSIDVVGEYNLVDSAALPGSSPCCPDPMGCGAIAAAHKPSLRVELESQTAGVGALSFCGLYTESESQCPFKDNVGITPLVLEETPATGLSYLVALESTAPTEPFPVPSLGAPGAALLAATLLGIGARHGRKLRSLRPSTSGTPPARRP
jgi:hypothetical protein